MKVVSCLFTQAQQKNTKNEMDAGSGIMSNLEDYQTIHFENFNTYNLPYSFPEIHLTFSKGVGRNELFHHKGREQLAGPH